MPCGNRASQLESGMDRPKDVSENECRVHRTCAKSPDRPQRSDDLQGGVRMFTRSVPLLALLLMLSPQASAAQVYGLRVPQIPVSGTGLQGYFGSMGESIDVQQAQVDAQLMQMYLVTNSPYTIQLEVGLKEPGVSLGLYDGSTLTESFVELFPAASGPGWFAIVSFRVAPSRIVVNLFDSNAALVSARTILGGNRQAIGFYVQGPDGVSYSQDARNPGGAAQVLLYRGTGINSGFMWIAFEASARANGADGDFDDAVLFMDKNQFVGPVHRTSWANLKERFRDR